MYLSPCKQGIGVSIWPLQSQIDQHSLWNNGKIGRQRARMSSDWEKEVILLSWRPVEQSFHEPPGFDCGFVANLLWYKPFARPTATASPEAATRQGVPSGKPLIHPSGAMSVKSNLWHSAQMAAVSTPALLTKPCFCGT